MAVITLGLEPEQLTVILNSGYPFAATLERTTTAGAPEDWPSAPVLTFSDNSAWTATISANVATFAQSAPEVAAKVALTERAVTLSVGGILWARGGVVLR